MMRSLYSGVSGLRTHQTRMDVIGNNISNVNTVGFKSSRVTFKDIFYQTVTYAVQAEDDGTRAGTNPHQIGMGAKVASIDSLNTRAGYQSTDRPLDCYINGEGYFKVMTPKEDEDDMVEYYTRVGNFSFDPLGQLVDNNGNIVFGAVGGRVDEDSVEGIGEVSPGEPIIIDGWQDYTQITINADGTITGIRLDDQSVEELAQLAIYTFANNDALSREGGTYLRPTVNSGTITVNAPGLGGRGDIETGGLEMSNVDLSKEFTDMIITQRGFQANSRIITVSDEMLQELVNLKR